MSLPSNTIDRIVANVLNQLGGSASSQVEVQESPSPVVSEKAVEVATLTIDGKVLTAESFEDVSCNQRVVVLSNALITPAAKDLIRERQLVIVRGEVNVGQNNTTSKATTSQLLNCFIVKHTDSLERAISEVNPNNKDLLGCPDDAAKTAISAICRGEANTVLIFVEQVHRAACLANRNDKVKAVVVADSGDVKEVRKQLRANVWCMNPKGRSYFELKNLLKTIQEFSTESLELFTKN